MAYSVDTDLFVAHVGDSRCYLRREGRLYCLTRDHTYAQELVRRGAMDAAEKTEEELAADERRSTQIRQEAEEFRQDQQDRRDFKLILLILLILSKWFSADRR